jgi:hypothetical protein
MIPSFGAEEHWEELSGMPTARFGLSVVEYEGTLFAIGGSDGNRLSTVEQYDSSTDTWTSRADMPTARKNVAAAVVDGKIYVFGGTRAPENSVLKTTEAYDPATDTWITLTDMPTGRLGLAAVPVDGKIYVIGGWGFGAFVSVVEVYDPATDTWETKAPHPSVTGNGGFAGFEGKVYMFGGNPANRITWVYDPVADQWETKAKIPHARLFPSATVLDGKFYVLGGSNSPAIDTVEVYDPGTDTWAEGLSMPTARGGLSAVTLNGKIYAIGGHTGISYGSVGTVYDTVEVYTPQTAPSYPTLATAAGSTTIEYDGAPPADAVAGNLVFDDGGNELGKIASVAGNVITLESALAAAIPAGSTLTFVVDNTGGASGGKLINISTRGAVGTGDDVLIGGFVIGTDRQQVYISATGPELSSIAGFLVDPVLTVTNITTGEETVNDNWEDTQAQLITDLWAGAPPLAAGSLSAALVMTLDTGSYTAKISGVGDTTGTAIIEVFEID